MNSKDLFLTLFISRLVKRWSVLHASKIVFGVQSSCHQCTFAAPLIKSQLWLSLLLCDFFSLSFFRISSFLDFFSLSFTFEKYGFQVFLLSAA